MKKADERFLMRYIEFGSDGGPPRPGQDRTGKHSQFGLGVSGRGGMACGMATPELTAVPNVALTSGALLVMLCSSLRPPPLGATTRGAGRAVVRKGSVGFISPVRQSWRRRYAPRRLRAAQLAEQGRPDGGLSEQDAAAAGVAADAAPAGPPQTRRSRSTQHAARSTQDVAARSTQLAAHSSNAQRSSTGPLADPACLPACQRVRRGGVAELEGRRSVEASKASAGRARRTARTASRHTRPLTRAPASRPRSPSRPLRVATLEGRRSSRVAGVAGPLLREVSRTPRQRPERTRSAVPTRIKRRRPQAGEGDQAGPVQK